MIVHFSAFYFLTPLILNSTGRGRIGDLFLIYQIYELFTIYILKYTNISFLFFIIAYIPISHSSTFLALHRGVKWGGGGAPSTTFSFSITSPLGHLHRICLLYFNFVRHKGCCQISKKVAKTFFFLINMPQGRKYQSFLGDGKIQRNSTSGDPS